MSRTYIRVQGYALYVKGEGWFMKDGTLKDDDIDSIDDNVALFTKKEAAIMEAQEINSAYEIYAVGD